jgi:hypothetical protein
MCADDAMRRRDSAVELEQSSKPTSEHHEIRRTETKVLA